MISINATLVLQVIQFLILVFILNRLMIQPTLKVIQKRGGFIEKTKEEIKGIELETERLREEFINIQDNARSEAAHERANLRTAGMNEADGFMEESRAQVQSIKAEAEKEAEKEIEQTKPLLNNEAAALAGEIIVKVIGRRVEA